MKASLGQFLLFILLVKHKVHNRKTFLSYNDSQQLCPMKLMQLGLFSHCSHVWNNDELCNNQRVHLIQWHIHNWLQVNHIYTFCKPCADRGNPISKYTTHITIFALVNEKVFKQDHLLNWKAVVHAVSGAKPETIDVTYFWIRHTINTKELKLHILAWGESPVILERVVLSYVSRSFEYIFTALLCYGRICPHWSTQ